MKKNVSQKHVLLLLFISIFGFFQTGISQTQNVGIFDASSDIGSCFLKGSSSYNPTTQEYTIAGSGANMWYEKDAFQFLYKKMKGDFILQFEFKFLGEPKNQHRKLGWMVRNDTAANSEYIDVLFIMMDLQPFNIGVKKVVKHWK